jgi:hypothetical protein
MITKVHLFSVSDQHTTAKYFERAIEADKLECCYWCERPDLSQFDEHDLLLFIDPASDWPLGLEGLSCKTAAYFIDVHLSLEPRLRLGKFFDLIFVAQTDYVERFEAYGHRQVHWLPLACDHVTHCQPSDEKPYDVGFVGKLGRRGTWRYETLTAVLTNYNTNDYNRFYQPSELGKIYGESSIVFNASIGKELNMRFFEAMASGALLITDRIPAALDGLFVEGVHFVGYTDVKEAKQKIDYYLCHESERLKIASTGQQLALAEHTYQHRWRSIKALATTCEHTAMARRASRHELAVLYAEIFVDLRRPARIFKVIASYGMSFKAIFLLLKSTGRIVNTIVPLTPNAIRQRLRTS